MNSAKSSNLKLKYQRVSPWGCKKLGLENLSLWQRLNYFILWNQYNLQALIFSTLMCTQQKKHDPCRYNVYCITYICIQSYCQVWPLPSVESTQHVFWITNVAWQYCKNWFFILIFFNSDLRISATETWWRLWELNTF